MGYAINQYNGMRAIDDASALLAGETYCDELPTPWPPAPTLQQQWITYQSAARQALAATDTTVVRVQEAIALGATTATAADVVAYMQYRKQLRGILQQPQPTNIPATLPAAAPYPANT